MTTSKLPPNIEEFNEITGVIFAELYAAHPIAQTLDIDRIAKLLGRERVGQLASGRKFDEVFANTLPWLMHEEYLFSDGNILREKVRLTEKALVAMNAVPSSLGRSRGSELVEATKQASTDAGRSKLVEIIAGLAEGVTKGVFGAMS